MIRIRPSTNEIALSNPSSNKTIVETTTTGISIYAVDFFTTSGAIAEDNPKMIRIFKMLLPTMLPMVISALPFKQAEILTAASGALVPIATIVKPITI